MEVVYAQFWLPAFKKEMTLETSPPEISGAPVAFFTRFFIGKKATAESGTKFKKCQMFVLQIFLIKICEAN